MPFLSTPSQGPSPTEGQKSSSQPVASGSSPHKPLTISFSSSSTPPPRPLVDDSHLQQSWEDIVYAGDTADQSSWQKWLERTYQAIAHRSDASVLTYSPSASETPAAPPHTRHLIPALSYPHAGDLNRHPGGSFSDAGSSKALEQAVRSIFQNPSRSMPTQALLAKKQRLGVALHQQGWAPSVPDGGSDNVPNSVQGIPSRVLYSQALPQVPIESRPTVSLPAESATPPPLPGGNDDSALIILLPLLILLSTLLLILLIFLVLLVVIRRRARIALLSSDGPLDVGREEELEGAGGLEGLEERWMETVDEPTRRGYGRAKDWLLSHPSSSSPSDMTMSQLLSIQEKGVSAWSFEPDYEANSSCYVEARTEITFLADGQGMAPQEGGGCSVQSNLPLPKINEVYYWEAKIFTKPDTTTLSVGLATKPYPSFRLPGWSKHSVGYFSSDGFKCHNYPFAAQSYGPAYLQGDVIGVGYRPRTGTAFFTRNGKKLEDAFIGLHRYNLFPTIGANGPAEVHVNLGQAAFVVIEANVKKWGLAPMTGTLGPPPAYGQERGSILIEAAGQSSSGGRSTPPPPPSPFGEAGNHGLQIPYGHGHGHSRRPRRQRHGRDGSRRRESLNAASHQVGVMAEQEAAERDRGRDGDNEATPGMERRPSTSSSSYDAPINPPTPGHLDISLHSLRSGRRERGSNESLSSAEGNSSRSSNTLRLLAHTSPSLDPTAVPTTDSYFPPTPTRGSGPREHAQGPNRSTSPPPYSERTSSTLTAPGLHPRGSSNSSPSGSLGGTPESGHRPRRSSGRTHRIANSVFGVLADTVLNGRDEGGGRGGLLGDSESRPGRPQRNSSELEYERLASGSRDRGTGQQHHHHSQGNTWGEALASWWFGEPSQT